MAFSQIKDEVSGLENILSIQKNDSIFSIINEYVFKSEIEIDSELTHSLKAYSCICIRQRIRIIYW